MEQRDGQMVINTVTTIGEEMTKKVLSYPISLLRGLLTEGSHLLLMRLFALRKKVPKHMIFVSLDQQFHIIHNTYSELGLKQLGADGEVLEVFGVQRVIHPLEGISTTWQCYFLDDGHLASGVQVGSPVTVRLLQWPSQTERCFEKTSLVWEEDMQMCSEFLERRKELQADHASYLGHHPQIRALISDFLQFLLFKKPGDVYQFAREYFIPFASGHFQEQP
ncbi:ciliogenesis-associated TTC17-interacting protein-like [Xenentodon cancila]